MSASLVSRPRRLLTVGHSYVVALNRRLARALSTAGDEWDVTVVAPNFIKGDLRPIPLERADGEPYCLEGVPTHFNGRAHVMLYGRGLRGLLREKWDLVHCWEEPFVLAGAQLAGWCRSAPVVFYTFQNICKRYPPPFNCIERYSVGRSAGWIAAGETVADALRTRAGYGRLPHCVIPLGVDVDYFRPDAAAGRAVRERLGWSADRPPVVGYLGRFVPEKGLRFLIDTLDGVQTPWRALFVGGGPLLAELQAWAGKRPDAVRVVTGVAHGEVPQYLNAMDLLAAPSQTTARWKEQLGRMLIEAFACGVPVVGSDSGEIPYVVSNAGRVVGEGDVEGWKDAIGELLENPARRIDFAGRGRDRACREFAWPVIARRHLEFFEDLVGAAV
jgi:glycosyltransferase involved in cell wall biosynthesis